MAAHLHSNTLAFVQITGPPPAPDRDNTKRRRTTTGAGVEEEKAARRRKLGVSREVGVVRTAALDSKHPGRGGSEGYPIWYRQMMIDLYEGGHAVPKRLVRSIQRWRKHGPIPLRKTGNRSTATLDGFHLLLLVMFKRAYPHSTNSHCAVFIALHAEDGRVFTDQEIGKGLRYLDMTWKKGSTTAYNAFTPESERKYYSFWNYDFPAGIVGVPRRVMIDGDEMALALGDVNLSYGHAVKGCRMRKIGHYGRGFVKITIIMFIEAGDPTLPAGTLGSIEKPRIWYHLSKDKGTSAEKYSAVLRCNLFNKMRSNEPKRLLMHDRLSSHLSDLVYDTVRASGHDVIPRPPYRPNCAPIEWVFDQLACSIRRRWELIHNEDDLIHQIRLVIEKRIDLGGFNDLFIKCGYRYDGQTDIRVNNF